MLKKTTLPHHSTGFFNRIKNIYFFKKLNSKILHITGSDHYLLVKKYKNKKVVLTIHDIEIVKRTTGIKRFILKKIWFDIPIRNADVVTTISQFSKREIEQLCGRKKEIKVIYNPLTLPIKFTPKRFNFEKPRILAIGTKSNKNLVRLINSLSSVSCKLIIVGKLSENVKCLLIDNMIDYENLFGLSSDEICKEYQQCDILSFISTYEGFGLPILEAQSCGRVVVASNIASIPEVAKESVLLVNPYSEDDIRKGFMNVISDNVLRERLVNKGIENVKRFSIETISKQYEDLYKDLTQ